MITKEIYATLQKQIATKVLTYQLTDAIINIHSRKENKIMNMLIGIDYTQDGSRTISHLESDINNGIMKQGEILAILENKHDEVYSVEVDQNCKEFIEEIVTKGTRIS